jgi:hypothetical protein
MVPPKPATASTNAPAPSTADRISRSWVDIGGARPGSTTDRRGLATGAAPDAVSRYR